MKIQTARFTLETAFKIDSSVRSDQEGNLFNQSIMGRPVGQGYLCRQWNQHIEMCVENR